MVSTYIPLCCCKYVHPSPKAMWHQVQHSDTGLSMCINMTGTVSGMACHPVKDQLHEDCGTVISDKTEKASYELQCRVPHAEL